MHILNTHLSDIVSGYERIRQSEIDLQSKWRPQLLATYAGQRAAYEEELEEYNQNRSEFSRRLRLGVWMASALLVLGLLVLPGLILINELGDFRGPLFCFAPILILGGLTGWAIIVVLWIWLRDQEKPIPPTDPLKSGVLSPLVPLWKEGLRGELPSKKPHPGATGEYHFIVRLQTLEEDFYVLYGIQQRTGEDIDVILVGTKGVWVFEVKYLKGIIRWRDGVWTQIQSVGRLNPRSIQEIREADQPYEDQWKRATEDVIKTIQRHAPEVIATSPEVTRVRGGIVFTHPKGRYDIPQGCTFNWGVIPFWLEKLRTVSIQPGMDEDAIMQVIDALLRRHHQIIKGNKPYSMNDYADLIFLKAEENIRKIIDLEQSSNDET
jgi:hypothetical protein